LARSPKALTALKNGDAEASLKAIEKVETFGNQIKPDALAEANRPRDAQIN
jgi:hypothetical protein